MNRAECIGNIDAVLTGQISQRLCKVRIILGLACIIAQVLQQEDLTRLQCRRLCLCVLTDNILCQDHFLAQQLAQTCRNRSHGQFRLPLALRLAHVGACDDCCVVLQQILNGRESRADTLVIRDNAAAVLGHRNIKIAAKEDLLTVYVNILDALLVIIHVNNSFITWFVLLSSEMHHKNCLSTEKLYRFIAVFSRLFF